MVAVFESIRLEQEEDRELRDDCQAREMYGIRIQCLYHGFKVTRFVFKFFFLFFPITPVNDGECQVLEETHLSV